MRHKSKSRIKPCLRPQRQQRRTRRDENFGLRSDFAIWAVVAIELVLKRESKSLIEGGSVDLVFGRG